MIVLFATVVLFHNLRSVCLHYDNQDVHNPSFLTFRTIHAKKTKFNKISYYFLFVTNDVENQSFCHLELEILSPAHFSILVIDKNISYQLLSQRQNAIGTRLLNNKQNFSSKQKRYKA